MKIKIFAVFAILIIFSSCMKDDMHNSKILELGVSLEELIKKGVPVEKLYNAGATLKELIDAHAPLNELILIKGITLKDLVLTKVPMVDLIALLKSGAVSFDEMIDSGIGIGVIAKAGYTDELVKIGYMGYLYDVNGREYKWVKIGNQKWMAEDLKTNKYADGTSIDLVPDNTSIYSTTQKSYFLRTTYYDYFYNIYPINENGYYYTWAAVMNDSPSNNDLLSNVQGVCPCGWHVPSVLEFKELMSYVGYDYIMGLEGLALRSDYSWYEDMEVGIDYYGFTALPKGYHYSDHYGETGEGASFWTTREEEYESFGIRYNADFFTVKWNYADISSSNKVEGRNVRCVKNR